MSVLMMTAEVNKFLNSLPIRAEREGSVEEILSICMLISRETAYYAFFSYSPHVGALRVHVVQKSDYDEYLYETGQVYIDDDDCLYDASALRNIKKQLLKFTK